MTEATDSESARLFYEPGASWYWVLAGPGAAVAMLLIQASNGYGLKPLVPLIFLALVSAFVALQVQAARIHTSVELTNDSLRQGTQTIRVAEILQVYPDAEHANSADEVLKWQSARALGELVGVPRGRVGIGLKLTERRTAQAWARRHRHLRAALTPLVEERVGRPQSADPADRPHVDDDDAGSPR